MKKELIEIETLKQLERMNKENKVRPSLMTPKHYDGSMIVTNSFVAIKVDGSRYKEDNRTDYPNNAIQLFSADPVAWIELPLTDMKALKEIAASFKRLKETNIIITFDQYGFIIEGYNNKVKTILPYQDATLSGDIVGKSISMNPKYIEQILAYYIKLQATSVNLELTSERNPIKFTSGPVQYLASQMHNRR